jgi:gas vesicle protein
MALEQKQQQGLLVGALIGAVLGAGTAYLLMSGTSEEGAKEVKPIKASELINLTSSAAILIRKLDDLRRRT